MVPFTYMTASSPPHLGTHSSFRNYSLFHRLRSAWPVLQRLDLLLCQVVTFLINSIRLFYESFSFSQAILLHRRRCRRFFSFLPGFM